jgi:LmbE family N-acetylglucosaminyl deacetylase
MAGRILAVVAHPDDEIIGLGGTLAKHSAAGDDVHVLILAQGATSRVGARRDEVESLIRCAQDAATVLGITPPLFGDCPDNRMDGLDLLDVVKTVEAVVSDVSPDIVFTHHGGDLNVDHRRTHEAVLTACRPLPSATSSTILTFETLSSTEWQSTEQYPGFSPNYFVDISAHLEIKNRALDCYAGEMRTFPHPRSIDAITHLARLRGATAGVAAAEAFQLVRMVR